MNNDLMHKLDKVQKLAVSGRLTRAMHQPLRYLATQCFLKLVYPKTHKGILKQADTFFGQPMEVLLPAATDIYLAGGKTHDSEIRLARYMIKSIGQGQVYLDIGAHFGYFTLLAAKLAGEKGKVYAVEPSKGTYSILQRNVSACANITALNNAMSDREEAITFYEFPVLYSEYNSMNIQQFEQEDWIKKYQPQKTEIPALVLDTFIESMQAKPNFIKIDVEGAEDKVISGGLNALRQHAPVIIMEFLSEGRFNTVHFKALGMLKNVGYRTWIIDKQGELRQEDDIKSYFTSSGIDSDNIVFKK